MGDGGGSIARAVVYQDKFGRRERLPLQRREGLADRLCVVVAGPIGAEGGHGSEC